MMFQTYMKSKETGKWLKFDPCPEPFDQTRKTVRIYRMLMMNKNHAYSGYSHIVAMPTWSFA